jgi:hypothetical protein
MKLKSVLIMTMAAVTLAVSGAFANVSGGIDSISTGNLFLVVIAIAAFFDISMKLLALNHILKHTECRSSNRVWWVIIVVFLNFLGPVLYFCMCRSNKNISK